LDNYELVQYFTSTSPQKYVKFYKIYDYVVVVSPAHQLLKGQTTHNSVSFTYNSQSPVSIILSY